MEENTTEVTSVEVTPKEETTMDTQQVKVLTTDSGYDYTGCTTLAALADVRSDVKDAESSVKERISISDNQRQVAELNLHNRLCDAEKAAIEAKWAGITQTKDSEMHIADKIDHCCEETMEFLTAFQKDVDEKFCELERRTLEGEIAELKQEKADGVSASLLNAINALSLKIK